MAIYAGDAVVEDPVGSEPYVGAEAMRAYWGESNARSL